MKIKIVKLTDANGDIVYKLKKFNLFGFPTYGYLWRDGDVGSAGETFKTYEEAEKVKNSFNWKEEIIK